MNTPESDIVTWHCFGDLRPGDTFIFHNPFVTKQYSDQLFIRTRSGFKYADATGKPYGRTWKTGARTGVQTVGFHPLGS